MPIKIAGIVGSLRKESLNKKLMNTAVALCPSDAEIEVLDWSSFPVFNADLESNMPKAVVEFKEKIRAADAVLFVTPEYNYSVPGPLKNVIDWGSRPFGDSCWGNKPVAVMGVSNGPFGTVRSQMVLRQIFVSLNMHPVQTPQVLVTNGNEKFDAEGNFTDEKGREVVARALQALIDLTIQLKK